MTWAVMADIVVEAGKTLGALGVALAATEMLISAFGGGKPR